MEREESLYVGRVEVKQGTLNMRSEPQGPVMAQLSAGELVDVLADEGEWVRIACGAGEGYAAKRYILFAQAKTQARLVIEDDQGRIFTPEGGAAVRIASGPID